MDDFLSNRPADATLAVMKKYPRLTAHVICESLGYACPSTAANIIRDAKEGNQNWCDWIYSCYRGNPMTAVSRAVLTRHHHRGYMADYPQALALVRQALEAKTEPLFASWF